MVVEVVASVYDVEIWNVCVMRVCVLGIFRLDHEILKSVKKALRQNSHTLRYPPDAPVHSIGLYTCLYQTDHRDSGWKFV